MNFDYSPFNPLAWGIFFGAWVAIGIIVNSYRSKYGFDDTDNEGE